FIYFFDKCASRNTAVELLSISLVVVATQPVVPTYIYRSPGWTTPAPDVVAPASPCPHKTGVPGTKPVHSEAYRVTWPAISPGSCKSGSCQTETPSSSAKRLSQARFSISISPVVAAVVTSVALLSVKW